MKQIWRILHAAGVDMRYRNASNFTGARLAGYEGKYRDKLVNAMTAQGFTNYDLEWWHFSFNAPNPVRFDMVIR